MPHAQPSPVMFNFTDLLTFPSMSKSHPPQIVATAYDQWLAEQILKLSVDALVSEVLTCTACAQSTFSEYVIEYQGETFRYFPEKTYAFLKFVTEGLSQYFSVKL